MNGSTRICSGVSFGASKFFVFPLNRIEFCDFVLQCSHRFNLPDLSFEFRFRSFDSHVEVKVAKAET